MTELAAPLYAAVLFAEQEASVGVAERIKGGRRLSGAGFESLVGKLGGELIVAAWPAGGEADFARMLPAMLAAYRPSLVIGAGFSDQASEKAPVGTSALGSRVYSATEETLRLVYPSGFADRFIHGALAEHAGDPEAIVARNEWCYRFAEACAAASQPAALATVVTRDPAAPVDPASRHFLRQQTHAAAAGALVRAAWRSPSSLLTLLKRKSDGWSHQETLADLIEAILEADD